MFRNLLVQCSPRVGTLLILVGAFSVAHAAIFANTGECVNYNYKILHLSKALETDESSRNARTMRYGEEVTLKECQGTDLYDDTTVTIPAGKGVVGHTLQKIETLEKAQRQAEAIRAHYRKKEQPLRRLASSSRDPVVTTRLLEEIEKAQQA